MEILVALALDWPGNVLAETPVTKADALLDIRTAEWDAVSKPLLTRHKSAVKRQFANCTHTALSARITKPSRSFYANNCLLHMYSP